MSGVRGVTLNKVEHSMDSCGQKSPRRLKTMYVIGNLLCFSDLLFF